MQTVAPGRACFPLLLLVLLFGLPPLAGWIYILNPQWLPDRQKNHGTLISPPRPLQSLQLVDDRNHPFDWSRLSGQWILIARNSGACGSGCRQRMHDLQQIRRAVGAERIRVQPLLIQESETTAPLADDLDRPVEGARVLQLAAGQQPQFDQLFSLADTDQHNAIYLADPNGMLMMGYRGNSPKKNILKDLETLLKASRHWTTGVNNGHG